MQRFFLLLSALIVIGAGCGSAAPATSPPPPPAAAPAPAAPAKAEPSDVRVAEIKAVGNAAGNITAEGCDGPTVDMVIKVQNFGPDFPNADGLVKVKEMAAAQQGQFGAVPFEETELFRVTGQVDFAGKAREFVVLVKPGDLPGGKLTRGQTLDLKTFVYAPCCDPLPETMKITASIMQSSSLIPTGERGWKEPFEQESDLALPDITPGHGSLLIKKGMGTGGVTTENVGKAPTAGPVEVLVSVPRKGGGFSALSLEGRHEQPFTGTVNIGPMTPQNVTGEPDSSKVELTVRTLCPSEVYDIIHDANPQNNKVTRDITISEQAAEEAEY